mgnify:FL=1
MTTILLVEDNEMNKDMLSRRLIKKGYDIVLRPHPVENLEAWKIYLHGIPNVHIIRDGSITPWINNAFAVMHNRCTTALEATISNKPVVTYIPFKNMQFSDAPSNKIGEIVQTPEELLEKVNKIFEDSKSIEFKKNIDQIPQAVSNKIYIDENELSAQKIVNVWDSLLKNSFYNSSNWKKFKWLLRVYKIRKMIGKARRSLLGNFHKDNNKFPILKKNDIKKRVSKLQNVLNINKIECELLSDRTILIKPKNFD